MKHNFVKILIAALLAFGHAANGQSNIEQARFKDGDVALFKFLNKKFSEETRKYPWPSCVISAVFAKFTIDTAGHIKTLVFSELKGTPQVLRTMLQATILSTNGLWIPCKVNGKAVESKPFLLPLIYNLESGCNPQDVTLNHTYKPVPNGLDTDLRLILDFEDNVGTNTTQLDCILLKPLHIFSVN